METESLLSGLSTTSVAVVWTSLWNDTIPQWAFKTNMFNSNSYFKPGMSIEMTECFEFGIYKCWFEIDRKSWRNKTLKLKGWCPQVLLISRVAVVQLASTKAKNNNLHYQQWTGVKLLSSLIWETNKRGVERRRKKFWWRASDLYLLIHRNVKYERLNLTLACLYLTQCLQLLHTAPAQPTTAN